MFKNEDNGKESKESDYNDDKEQLVEEQEEQTGEKATTNTTFWVDNSGDNFFNFSRYSADDVEYLPTTKAKSKRIKRILMVDDELDITFSVKTALEDSGLFQVDMFND